MKFVQVYKDLLIAGDFSLYDLAKKYENEFLSGEVVNITMQYQNYVIKENIKTLERLIKNKFERVEFLYEKSNISGEDKVSIILNSVKDMSVKGVVNIFGLPYIIHNDTLYISLSLFPDCYKCRWGEVSEEHLHGVAEFMRLTALLYYKVFKSLTLHRKQKILKSILLLKSNEEEYLKGLAYHVLAFLYSKLPLFTLTYLRNISQFTHDYVWERDNEYRHVWRKWDNLIHQYFLIKALNLNPDDYYKIMSRIVSLRRNNFGVDKEATKINFSPSIWWFFSEIPYYSFKDSPIRRHVVKFFDRERVHAFTTIYYPDFEEVSVMSIYENYYWSYRKNIMLKIMQT